MKRFLYILLMIAFFTYFGVSQSVKDEEIKIEISKDSPLKGKKVLVFASPSEYSTMSKDSDLKFLVDTINSYLADLGIEYVDFKTSLNLSKKFLSVYEEKKGESMSIAQMLATEIKAPVYIEIDVDSSVQPYTKKGWTLVNGIATLKAYDSSTARGLGTAQAGNRLVNNSEDADQAKKIILTYIAKKTLVDLLPKLEKYLAKGEKIDLKVIGLNGLKEVKDFSNFLNVLPGLQESKRTSLSGDTAVFEVIYGGGVEAFVNDLADMSVNYPEYENVDVQQSGNSVVITIKK